MNNEFKVGSYVHYCPSHGAKENGRIKSIGEEYAFVVFHCAGEWDRYQDYTGQRTALSDLRYGWVDENGNLKKEFCDHYYIPTNAKWQSAIQMKCCHCGNIIN